MFPRQVRTPFPHPNAPGPWSHLFSNPAHLANLPVISLFPLPKLHHFCAPLLSSPSRGTWIEIADDPLRLRYDMARQFDMDKAVDVRDLGGGAKRFNIYMTLGVTKKRLFVTGWIQDTPNSKPRIVTSFRKNEANKHD